MSKPRLCTLLDVEPMEEFQSTDPRFYYRIDDKGHVFYQERKVGEWKEMANQFHLEQIIEEGITKRCSLDAQQFSYLKFLHELFYAEILDREASPTDGLYIQSMKRVDGGRNRVHIPAGSCLDRIFEKSLVPIYIANFLERYEEAHNV